MTRAETQKVPSKFVAGEVCLDFANTLDWHASTTPRENLHCYADLVAWCRGADLLDSAEADRLLREAQSHPATATRTLKRAIKLRDVIDHLGLSIVRRKKPISEDVELLNSAVGSANLHRQNALSKDGFVWVWKHEPSALDSML